MAVHRKTVCDLPPLWPRLLDEGYYLSWGIHLIGRNSCVDIGYCSDVAIGSSVLANTKIGNYAMLGSANLVTPNIPDGEIWVGNPARFLKPMCKG